MPTQTNKTMPLKIVVDNKIAQIDQVRQFGAVTELDASQITATTLADADALIVRTATAVNAELIESTNLKFIGSATIGCDHVDLTYLKNSGIAFANAPGCNARAVVEYVVSSLLSLYRYHDLQHRSIGIVGCGNIGLALYLQLRQLGLNAYCYDPYKTGEIEQIATADWLAFDAILQCDIISLHTPLTVDGDYPTEHLLSPKQLEKMQHDACLINTSRGAVVDNSALLRKLQSSQSFNAVLDVWQQEPNINSALLNAATIGTAHIAGYSQRGKNRATTMVLDKMATYFGLESAVYRDETNTSIDVDADGLTFEQTVLRHFNPQIESKKLKASFQSGQDFKRLRDTYTLRRETSEVRWLNISRDQPSHFWSYYQ